jgi:hypothetical protein
MAPTRTTRLALALSLAFASFALAVPPAAAWVCAMDAHHFEVNGKTVPLDGAHVHSGDTLTVKFTLNDGCSERRLSFAAYNTTTNQGDLDAQTLFDSDTGVFGMGEHSLTVTVPPCYFQLDFVFGTVIEKFDTAHGGPTYHTRQTYTEFPNDFIDGLVGGAACETHTTTTTSSSTTTKTTTTEIPFFSTTAALLVGVGGALAGVALVLRRRL